MEKSGLIVGLVAAGAIVITEPIIFAKIAEVSKRVEELEKENAELKKSQETSVKYLEMLATVLKAQDLLINANNKTTDNIINSLGLDPFEMKKIDNGSLKDLFDSINIHKAKEIKVEKPVENCIDSELEELLNL